VIATQFPTSWIIVIVLILISVAGCTDFQFKTFDGQYFSFKYPDGWEAKATVVNESVVTVVPKNEIEKFNQSIITLKFLGNFNLTDTKIIQLFNPYSKTANNKPDPNFKMIENRTITVDGVNAKDFLLQDSSDDEKSLEEHELIYLEKNGKVYEIHLNSTPDDFFRAQGIFLDIVSSFKTA